MVQMKQLVSRDPGCYMNKTKFIQIGGQGRNILDI